MKQTKKNNTSSRRILLFLCVTLAVRSFSHTIKSVCPPAGISVLGGKKELSLPFFRDGKRHSGQKEPFIWELLNTAPAHLCSGDKHNDKYR